MRQYFLIEENKNKLFVNYERLGFLSDKLEPYEHNIAIKKGIDNRKELNALYLYINKFGDIPGVYTPLDNIRDPDKDLSEVHYRAPDNEHSVAFDVISWLGSNVGFDFIRELCDLSGYTLEKSTNKKKNSGH